MGSPLHALDDEPNIETETESLNPKLNRGQTGDLLPHIAIIPSTINPTSAFGTDSHGLQGFINPEFNMVWKLNPITKRVARYPGVKAVIEPAATFSAAVTHEALPSSHLFAVATTSEGTTAAVFTPPAIAGGPAIFVVRLYDSLERFLRYQSGLSPVDVSPSNFQQHQLKSEESFYPIEILGHPIQVAANATGFILLTSDGNVWTWGDKRFPQALGRTGIATKPGLVDELVGCKIVKVAAGGWMCGCVSEAGEAWIWGSCAPGGDENLSGVGIGAVDARGGITPLAGLTQGEIAKVELPLRPAEINGSTEDDEEESIVDIAIGDVHVLVLDGHGNVWCCGRNVEGQLGILRGEDCRNAKFEKNWVKAEVFGQGELTDWKVTSVACGDLTSFAVVEREV